MSDGDGSSDSKHIMLHTLSQASSLHDLVGSPQTTLFSSCVEYKNVIDEDIRHREIK